MSGVYWGLAGTLGTQGPEQNRYRSIRGIEAPRGVRVIWGHQGVSWRLTGLSVLRNQKGYRGNQGHWGY